MEKEYWKGRTRKHEQSYSTRQMNGLAKEGSLLDETWSPATQKWRRCGITNAQTLLIADAVRMGWS